MKKYKIFILFIIVLEIISFLTINYIYKKSFIHNELRNYRVESSRVVKDIENYGYEYLDISKYNTIIAVSIFDENKYCNNDYLVEKVNGILYRIEYKNNAEEFDINIVNYLFVIMFFVSIIIFYYIGKNIIKPFNEIKNMPYELAKGNLTMPIKEQKSKYFGKFLWGMDMLRENLEDNKQKELQYQKEKKTLILSLSHDIKTPLSAIKLYSKALQDNLYKDEEKKQEAISGILKNIDEIEHYVNEIAKNSKEDFLNLSVNNGEFFLSQIIDKIRLYYNDKLNLMHIGFVIEEFSNCLLKGDKERVIEVLQNVMENAIKYGDGKSIKIDVLEEENCKLISIKNTGCNVPENELSHIFDSFYRGNNSKKQSGSGLGLYICKPLMHKMDGDIFAKIIDNNCFEITIVVRKK